MYHVHISSKFITAKYNQRILQIEIFIPFIAKNRD